MALGVVVVRHLESLVCPVARNSHTPGPGKETQGYKLNLQPDQHLGQTQGYNLLNIYKVKSGLQPAQHLGQTEGYNLLNIYRANSGLQPAQH